jgi:hypothetical protein
MTTPPDALLPSAKEVMQKIALAEAEEAAKQARLLTAAQAEKKALIDEQGPSLSQPAVHGQGPRHQSAGARLGKTLTGSPKEIYQLWDKYFRPRGYKLKVQIVDFPDGLPGDIAMTLRWA